MNPLLSISLDFAFLSEQSVVITPKSHALRIEFTPLISKKKSSFLFSCKHHLDETLKLLLVDSLARGKEFTTQTNAITEGIFQPFQTASGDYCDFAFIFGLLVDCFRITNKDSASIFHDTQFPNVKDS